jgi:hypothetical protein
VQGVDEWNTNPARCQFVPTSDSLTIRSRHLVGWVSGTDVARKTGKFSRWQHSLSPQARDKWIPYLFPQSLSIGSILVEI